MNIKYRWKTPSINIISVKRLSFGSESLQFLVQVSVCRPFLISTLTLSPSDPSRRHEYWCIFTFLSIFTSPFSCAGCSETVSRFLQKFPPLLIYTLVYVPPFRYLCTYNMFTSFYSQTERQSVTESTRLISSPNDQFYF